jgi:hypothetical protein
MRYRSEADRRQHGEAQPKNLLGCRGIDTLLDEVDEIRILRFVTQEGVMGRDMNPLEPVMQLHDRIRGEHGPEHNIEVPVLDKYRVCTFVEQIRECSLT